MTDQQNHSMHQPDTASFQKRLIRRRFLESVSAVMLVGAFIALPSSLFRIFWTGLNYVHIVHCTMAVVVVVLFIFRKRLGDPWLTFSILFVFTVLSIVGFLQYGIVSAGFYFAAAYIFIAGVTLGLRSGIICAGFFAVVTFIIAYLWMSGYLVFPGDVREYILQPSVWATLGVAFIITTAVFFISASGLLTGLTELVDTIDEQKRQIEEHSAELAQANQDLAQALKEIRTLTGLLPICSNCKKIRDDKGYWQQVELYVQNHTQAVFTHGICPDCMKELYPEIADQVIEKLEIEESE